MRRRRRPPRTRRRLALATLALLSLAATAGVAAAHGRVGSRFDAPVPLGLVYGGAGATVALTAAWLAATDAEPAVRSPRRTLAVPPTVARAARAGARLLAFALFAAVVVDGVAGRQVAAGNLATVVVWPLWLKGLALVAVLAGDPWRVLSPWRTVHVALSRLEGRELGRYAYPSWLGEWPAVAGFVVGVGIVENLTGVPRSPAATATLVTAYATAMVVGGLAFGRTFFDRADTLAVLYALFGRVAPLSVARTDAGGYRVGLRAPWTDHAPVRSVALVAFVVATVSTVTFDGLVEAPEYQDALFAVRDLAGSSTGAGAGLYLAGLSLFLAVFAAASAAARALGTASVAGWTASARAFAPTVVPIAAAYEVAHNYPYVLGNAGAFVGIVRGCLGGTAGAVDPLAALSVSAFWWSQVALVVAGHVVAVVAAHRVAAAHFDGASAARRGHLPFVVVMVGYTVLSLWVVSRPVAG